MLGVLEPGLPAVHVQLDAAALDVNEGVVGGRHPLCEDTGDPRLSLQLVPHMVVDPMGVVGVLAVVQTQAFERHIVGVMQIVAHVVSVGPEEQLELRGLSPFTLFSSSMCAASIVSKC